MTNKETIEEFLKRGGKVKTLSPVVPKDSGKYGKTKWRYHMADVRPEENDVPRKFGKTKSK